MIGVRVASPALAGASPTALAGLSADLAFCHPAISAVTAVTPSAVELVVDADSDDLRAQVEQVVALSVASYRFVRRAPPLWSHEALARYARSSAGLARFVERYTIELGPGQYALCGPAAQLRSWIDARLRALAAGFGAEPWHLPSIESTAGVLAATGYLAAHAQHVTFGYRLPCHFERLRSFASRVRGEKLERPDDPRDLEPTGFILEPFVCHNVYRALAGATITGGKAITAAGTCYRHEGFRFAPLVRQWEFSMREVVLVDAAERLVAQRQRLVDLTCALARELDLDAHLEIATDPFFVSEAASARTYQALRSTKLELSLALGDGRAIAGASFNLHGTHFTEPMAIVDEHGQRLETACVGWGIERWMAAVVARWGAEPDGWPR